MKDRHKKPIYDHGLEIIGMLIVALGIAFVVVGALGIEDLIGGMW